MFYQVAPRCTSPNSNVVFGTCNENFLQHRYAQQQQHHQPPGRGGKKEMFSSKPDVGDRRIGPGSGVGMSAGGIGGGGGGGGGTKNKWMKALKGIKSGGKDSPGTGGATDNGRHRSGGSGKDSVMGGGSSPALASVAAAATAAASIDAHVFQEYTYKKITPCDICSQILRGHTRQGLKCKLCRMNVHPDCQNQAPRCQPKGRLLLRRQRSASELDSGQQILQQQQQRMGYAGSGPGFEEEDKQQDDSSIGPTFPYLRSAAGGPVAANDGSGEYGGGRGHYRRPQPDFRSSAATTGGGNTLNVGPSTIASSSESSLPTMLAVSKFAAAGKRNRQRHLAAAATPGTAAGAPTTAGGAAAAAQVAPAQQRLANNGPQQDPSRLSHTAPSSPVHNSRAVSGGVASGPNSSSSSCSGRLLSSANQPQLPHSSSASSTPSSVANLHHLQHHHHLNPGNSQRMSSVDLPDENEKSISSASTSPCPSPMTHHRHFPQNVYVVLYNYKPRQADELDLKAGYKLSVLDNSDKDWWQGKFMGAMGFFPATYVTRLHPGERPLQVLQAINIPSALPAHEPPIKLLRDQIVIQLGEELRDGSVLIRTAENRQGTCPVNFLQEV